MTLKSYLITMSLISLVCWGVFIFILWSINPATTNWIGFLLFYFSLFLALTGTAAIIGFVIRFIAMKKELAFRLVKEAFRQSFLFAALIVFSLFLLSKDLFNWLNLALLIISLSTLEFFLLSFSKNNN